MGVGEKEHWENGLSESIPIAVPGSWNEQYENIRDYMDIAWYRQNTFIPESWKSQKYFCDSVPLIMQLRVWLNGKPIGFHEGGHLPFAFEITNEIIWGTPNRITVQVENILKPNRVPPEDLPAVCSAITRRLTMISSHTADWNAPVWLYTVPQNYMSDITVKTSIRDNNGSVLINVRKEGISKQEK